MFDFNRTCFNIIWTTLCIVATIGTTMWQISNYVKDDDMSVVQFKRFHDTEIDLYPSITLCFVMLFNAKELQKYGKDANALSYVLFLKGSQWNKDMLQIDYNNVSVNFNDFILAYGVTTYKGEMLYYYDAYNKNCNSCLLYTSPSPRDATIARMPSSA